MPKLFKKFTGAYVRRAGSVRPLASRKGKVLQLVMRARMTQIQELSGWRSLRREIKRDQVTRAPRWRAYVWSVWSGSEVDIILIHCIFLISGSWIRSDISLIRMNNSDQTRRGISDQGPLVSPGLVACSCLSGPARIPHCTQIVRFCRKFDSWSMPTTRREV